jgi:hypothetical protein
MILMFKLDSVRRETTLILDAPFDSASSDESLDHFLETTVTEPKELGYERDEVDVKGYHPQNPKTPCYSYVCKTEENKIISGCSWLSQQGPKPEGAVFSARDCTVCLLVRIR